jgi:hypothetical protein
MFKVLISGDVGSSVDEIENNTMNTAIIRSIPVNRIIFFAISRSLKNRKKTITGRVT